MNRIEEKLAQLKEQNKKAFITYMTAGMPDFDKMQEIIRTQEQAGTDIIELGIPFSDPVADGPVIQDASYHAILKGVNLKKVLEAMKKLRSAKIEIPIVFMMYYNTILHYGASCEERTRRQCGSLCGCLYRKRSRRTDYSGSAIRGTG